MPAMNPNLSPFPQHIAAILESVYHSPASDSKTEAGGESPNEAATAALAPVSAAFSRLSPIHPRGRHDHADSLAARTGGAETLAGASSVSQPLYRAATAFESAAVANKTVTEARAMTQNQTTGTSIAAHIAVVDGIPTTTTAPSCKQPKC